MNSQVLTPGFKNTNGNNLKSVTNTDSTKEHQHNNTVNDCDSSSTMTSIRKNESSLSESSKERITSILKSLSFDELDELLTRNNVKSSDFYKAMQALKKEHITELERILIGKINDSRKKSVTTEVIERYKNEIIDLTNRHSFSADKLAESLMEFQQLKKIKKPLKITTSVIRAVYQRLQIEPKRNKSTVK